MSKPTWIKGKSKNPILLPSDLGSLGRNIRHFRERRKLTVAQLAEIVGVSTTTLTNIEYGKYYWPSMPVYVKICRALKQPEPSLVAPYAA